MCRAVLTGFQSRWLCCCRASAWIDRFSTNTASYQSSGECSQACPPEELRQPWSGHFAEDAQLRMPDPSAATGTTTWLASSQGSDIPCSVDIALQLTMDVHGAAPRHVSILLCGANEDGIVAGPKPVERQDELK